MEIDLKTALAVGGVVASIAVAWGTARARVASLVTEINEIRQDMAALKRENSAQWAKYDKVHRRAVEESVHQEYLRRDVDNLIKKSEG